MPCTNKTQNIFLLIIFVGNFNTSSRSYQSIPWNCNGKIFGVEGLRGWGAEGQKPTYGTKGREKQVPLTTLYVETWNFTHFEQITFKDEFYQNCIQAHDLENLSLIWHNGTTLKALSHCVKSVQIRSFFWTRENSVFGHFWRSVTYHNFHFITTPSLRVLKINWMKICS